MKKRIELIFKNKTLFSGVAILMVMLYHQPPEGLVKGIYFYPGFAGVDIFLLFSGLGLCYSINKYSVLQFYKRRLVRILPMLILLGFCVSFNYSDYSVWDFFCNMTSLSYYKLGGDIYEWYLASLFWFYLLFPLLYACTSRCMNRNKWLSGGGILLIWVIILALVTTFNLPWYYQTALGRLPIFLLGIMCYLSVDNYKVGLVVYSIITMPIVLLLYKGLVNTYMLIYCIAPWLVFILTYIIPLIQKHDYLNKLFTFWGKRSLEVYVANVIVSIYVRNLLQGVEATIIYWAAHLIVIPVVCYINTIITKRVTV